MIEIIAEENEMSNISSEFLHLAQKEKEDVINEIVPSICQYCNREDCKGCFVQELTNAVVSE